MSEGARHHPEGQFELGLFMDLAQFEELERRVHGLIEKQDQAQRENAELHHQIKDLRHQLRILQEEREQWNAQQQKLLANQRDPQREELIRQKVAELLGKLESL